jgi:hypothetical protein
VVSTGSTGEGVGSTGEGVGSTGEGLGSPGSADDGPVARSERPRRYEQSPVGMVGALIVTLLVILAFVAFRAFNRSDLDVKPQRVDYLAQVRIAQRSAPHGAALVYPAGLPSGWTATHITFSPDATRPELELSMLTSDDAYVGFVQSPSSVAELLTMYVDPHPHAGPPVTVDGSVVRRWDTWTDSGGDTALSAERGHESLLVFGTVSRSRLQQLAAWLTTARAAG